MILLLITGVAALLFAIYMILDFVKNKKIFHLLWAIAFLVLFVAGVVLVVANDYDLLLSPLVSGLAVLIPGGVASGLYFTTIFDEKKSKLIGWAYPCIYFNIWRIDLYFQKHGKSFSANYSDDSTHPQRSFNCDSTDINIY